MIGHRDVQHLDGLYAPLANQPIHELAIVQRLKIAAQLRVFVLDGVETVGANSNHLFDIIAVQGFDVLGGHHLKQIFVAHAPRRVAGAGFLVAQDGEIHFGRFQHLDHRPGHRLAALLQRRGAAHPKQDFGVGLFRQRRHVQPLRPIGAGKLRAAPRMPPLLQADQGVHRRFGRVGFLQHHIAAQIHNGRHVFHSDWAFLHTSAAVQAIPNGGFGDGVVQDGRRLRVFRVARPLMPDAYHVIFKVFHDVHGRKQLAGDIGRAYIGTAPADGAGVAVQKLFPSEILHPRRPEPLGVFYVQQRQRPPRLQGAGKGVERRGNHVHMLGKGDVHREKQDDGEMRPPENAMQSIGGGWADAPIRKQPPQRPADDNVGFRSGAPLRHIKTVGQQGRRHQPGNHPDDDDGVGIAGKVKAEPPRAHHPAAGGGPDQHRQQHGGQNVQIAAIHHRPGFGKQPFRERPPNRGAENEYGVGQHKGKKAPENRGVSQPGPIAERHPLQHLFLSQHDEQCAGKPLPRAVKAGRGPALHYQMRHAAVKGIAAGGQRQGHQ